MTVSTSDRILAFLAYLLLVIGWVIVLLFGRRSRFAVFHMKQSIALVLSLAAIAAGWLLFAWLIAWVPLAFGLGMAAFSIVLAALFVGAIAWVMGMVNALRGKVVLLPFVGSLGLRLPGGAAAGSPLRPSGAGR
jgi:uncharacterized membrane protein